MRPGKDLGGPGITPRAIPFGNYYLLERLAVGGMAEVYLAKCFGVAGFERLVALKRILPTIAEDDEFIAMFIDEAKIAGQLNHANVAQIFDLGKINNSYFIAMEYISGHDLRAIWDRARESAGMPLELACYVTKKICEGLDYAHRRRDNRGRPLGIIHRDVSPQNVLLSYDGDVKVIDFGIAKAANRMVRTQTGILKGKFAYMAPEQARGEPTDHRSDVFAIGVILYELLTGERAFKADSDFALLEKVRKVDLISPRKLKPDIPRELERIVFKAMAREAGDRYAWASVMASDLDRFMTNHGLTYNKEELSAFVRGAYREDYDEERRRLGVYKGFRLDDDGDPAATADGDSDRDVSPDMATQLRADPSLEHDSEEDEIHEAGTEIGDAFTDQGEAESDYDDSEVDEGDSRPAPRRVRESTRLVSDENSAFGDETDTSTHTSPDRSRRSTRALSLGSMDIQSSVAESLLAGSPIDSDDNALVEAPTRVSVSQEEISQSSSASTRVFSREKEVSADDATMVDSNPVSGEKKGRPKNGAIPLAQAASARNGASPDEGRRGRGTALSEVLGGDELGDVSSRAALHHDPNPFSGPSRARRPATRARPAADRTPTPSPTPSSPTPSSPEPETFTRGPTALEGGSGANSGMLLGAVVGVVLGVLVAGPLGVLIGAGFTGGHDTLIVTAPREAEVKVDERVVCTQTPCAVSLGEGKHEMIFVAKGYDPLSKSVEHPGTGVETIDVRLPRRSAGIVLKTEPEGARVTLNGKQLTGETPLKLPDLVVGDKVKLKIVLKGYDTFEELLEVPELNDDQPWGFELFASETSWSLVTKPDDAILEERGRFRESKTGIKVARGQSEAVRVVRPGCEPENLSLQGTGRPTEERTVELRCRELDAKLTIKARSRLAVSLDGIELGRKNMKDYELPAGEYDVILRGRRKQERTVIEIKRGEVFELPTELRW